MSTAQIALTFREVSFAHCKKTEIKQMQTMRTMRTQYMIRYLLSMEVEIIFIPPHYPCVFSAFKSACGYFFYTAGLFD